MNIFILHDSDPEFKKRGAIDIKDKNIKVEDLKNINADGWGIFHSPNDFNGRRKADNLKKINYWIADIDDGTKEEQMNRINKLVLKPTCIVETKKGYHCYWKAKEGAAQSNYRHIAIGLIEVLKADKACKDVCRILRVPNYYHMKDPNNPFLVKTIYKDDRVITEEQMLYVYKLPEPKYEKKEYTGDKEDLLDEERWEKIFKLSHINEGGRNNNLTRIYFWLRDEGFPKDIIDNTILRMNSAISNPLPQWEILQLIRSKK